MRLFLSVWLLLAVTVFSLVAPHDDGRNVLRPVTRFQLYGGIPDGALITFFFKHTGNNDKPEPVAINFYDYPIVDVDEVYDITAHLKIMRDDYYPVASNSFEHGEWQTEERFEQPPGDMADSNGYWRVDVYKHNAYQLNVFFQGYWSDVRTFKRSLTSIQTIYIKSANVDLDSVKIHMKVPNSNLPPVSLAQFKDLITMSDKWMVDRKLVSFPALPVGTHIEMSVVLRASGGSKKHTPSLTFKPSGEGVAPFFMKIIQWWEYGTERLSIHHDEGQWGIGYMKNITHCIKETPNGDLQHLYLQRVSQDTLRLNVFYKSTGEEGIACSHTLPADLAPYMDKPFDIMSHDGAVLLHLQHSLPRTIGIKND